MTLNHQNSSLKKVMLQPNYVNPSCTEFRREILKVFKPWIHVFYIGDLNYYSK